MFFVKAQHNFRAKVDSGKAPGETHRGARAWPHTGRRKRQRWVFFLRSDGELAVRDLPDIMSLKYGTCVLCCALVKWSTVFPLRTTLVFDSPFYARYLLKRHCLAPQKRKKPTLVFLWHCGIVSISSCNVKSFIPVQFCIHFSPRF